MMRSLLYVPANSQKFITKAHERGADAIILDLEDSVLAAEKASARDGLATAVASVGQAGAQVFVRINAGDIDDAVAPAKAGAAGLMVPKIQSQDDLAALAAALQPYESGDKPLAFIGLIEDPGAVLNAASIAKAPRLVALATGGEDLATALGASPTPAVLHFPKLLVHYAAKAAGILSLGLLRSAADYADAEGIASAVREAKEHGFDGATCVHPNVVPLLNAGFLPSAEELDWARRVVAAASQAAGAFSLDGRMVDAPVVARARGILHRGNAQR